MSSSTAGTDRARLLSARAASARTVAAASGGLALLGWLGALLVYAQTPPDERVSAMVVLFAAGAVVATMAAVASAAVAYTLASIAEAEPIR